MAQPLQQPWTLIALRPDLPALYQAANAEGAHEWQTVAFWTAVLDVWRESSPEVLYMFHQVPPSPDPLADHSRRRIDAAVYALDRDTGRRVLLFFMEAKGAYASPLAAYEDVEAQVGDAMLEYYDSGPYTYLFGGVCVVGTRARVFEWSPGSIEPVDDTRTSGYDPHLFIDAASPKSSEIWHSLNHLKDDCGVANLIQKAEIPPVVQPPPTTIDFRKRDRTSGHVPKRPAVYGVRGNPMTMFHQSVDGSKVLTAEGEHRLLRFLQSYSPLRDAKHTAAVDFARQLEITTDQARNFVEEIWRASRYRR